jgi:hypothetical protein
MKSEQGSGTGAIAPSDWLMIHWVLTKRCCDLAQGRVYRCLAAEGQQSRPRTSGCSVRKRPSLGPSNNRPEAQDSDPQIIYAIRTVPGSSSNRPLLFAVRATRRCAGPFVRLWLEIEYRELDLQRQCRSIGTFYAPNSNFTFSSGAGGVRL